MIRTIIIAVTLIATSVSASAQGYPRRTCGDACKAAGGQYSDPSAHGFCYEPTRDLGCGVRWSGHRGGGRAWSPNCHYLPPCKAPR